MPHSVYLSQVMDLLLLSYKVIGHMELFCDYKKESFSYLLSMKYIVCLHKYFNSIVIFKIILLLFWYYHF